MKNKTSKVAVMSREKPANRTPFWIGMSLTLFAIAMMLCLLASPAKAANWQTPAAAMKVASATTPTTRATITSAPKFFQVTADDVGTAVSKAMKSQGLESDVTATMNPSQSKVIYSADHPLKLAIHGLQIDPEAKLWQAQAYIIAGNKTEAVKPVSGRYDATTRVPVLTRQLRQGDVIERGDIEFKTLAQRQLRKDTVTDVKSLIGQSPSRIISPGRPIRVSEVSQPVMVKKGQTVAMHYTTPYMSIRTSGQALEDGAKGSLIRVKNNTSEKAISARVVAAGRVEVNNSL